MTADLRGSRERERGCANRACDHESDGEDFIPFKINLDLYTSWQMATESGAEITQSTASGRLRVAFVVKGEISFEMKGTRRSGGNSSGIKKETGMIFGRLEMSAILE